jgi:GNAT superfamily N-acetyltransferase
MVHSELRLTEGDRIDPVEYRRLRHSTGWDDPAVDDDILAAALDTTWNVTARDEQGGLVGMARLLDDGALYATVWDMIVDPPHQHAGIGRAIFESVLARAGGRSLVSLVATAAGEPMYRAAGFGERSRGSTALFRRG